MIPPKGQYWHFDTVEQLNENKYEYLEHCKQWYLSEGLTDAEATQVAFTEYQIKLDVMNARIRPAREQFFSNVNGFITPFPTRRRGRPRKEK